MKEPQDKEIKTKKKKSNTQLPITGISKNNKEKMVKKKSKNIVIRELVNKSISSISSINIINKLMRRKRSNANIVTDTNAINEEQDKVIKHDNFKKDKSTKYGKTTGKSTKSGKTADESSKHRKTTNKPPTGKANPKKRKKDGTAKKGVTPDKNAKKPKVLGKKPNKKKKLKRKIKERPVLNKSYISVTDSGNIRYHHREIKKNKTTYPSKKRKKKRQQIDKTQYVDELDDVSDKKEKLFDVIKGHIKKFTNIGKSSIQELKNPKGILKKPAKEYDSKTDNKKTVTFVSSLTETEASKVYIKEKWKSVSSSVVNEQLFYYKPEGNPEFFYFPSEIPVSFCREPKYAWLFTENLQKDLDFEAKRIGGFQVNYSTEDVTLDLGDGEQTENAADPKWVKEYYTDSSLDSVTDIYYHFVKYKDYEAKVKYYSTKRTEEAKKAEKVEEEISYSKVFINWLLRKRKKKKRKINEQDKKATGGKIPIFGSLSVKELAERRAVQEGNETEPADEYFGVCETMVYETLVATFRPDFLAMSRDRSFKVPKTKEEGAQISLRSLDTFLSDLKYNYQANANPGLVLYNINTAISWAIIFTDSVTKHRAELLTFLSENIPSNVFRWFPKIVEAIIHQRINDRNTILGFVKILADVEAHKIRIDSLYTAKQINMHHVDNYGLLKKMNHKIFSTLYRRVNKLLNEKYNRKMETYTLVLIFNIATRYYKTGLLKHLDILCEILVNPSVKTNIQISAAILRLTSTSDCTLKDVCSWIGIDPNLTSQEGYNKLKNKKDWNDPLFGKWDNLSSGSSE